MAHFVVTYDLVKEKNYARLIAELERIGGAKLALSVWLVDQNMNAFDLRDHLMAFIDADDKLAVIEFSKKPAWVRAIKSGADWIAARYP